MNRTITDATVKRFCDENHDQLRTHLTNSSLPTPRPQAQDPQGFTYESICEAGHDREGFTLDQIQQKGSNI
ncbi:hypothetical protein [Mesorhizobium japonicum]|nr:hypothetical protein [Mesorhizobium japonicum]